MNQKINLLRHNARSMVRELGLLNDAYFEVGVTLAERHLLIELSQESITAKDVAKRLLLDKSTVSRLVARATKKGFITASSDPKDRRRQILQLTDLGKETLNTFEPIAFNQTKNALQTLSPEEANIVHRGVALYAEGLKNSRLNTQSRSVTKIESLEEINRQIHLEPYQPKDEEELYAIFQEASSQFICETNSKEEFHRLFVGPTFEVYICRSSDGQIIGGFYIKANYSGRSSHIANAGYIIKDTHRGLGYGSLLVKASLHLAKKRNFHALQFNMVLSQNKHAIKLYQKLGFEIIGTIPNAVRNPDSTFQDGHIMYRSIKESI